MHSFNLRRLAGSTEAFGTTGIETHALHNADCLANLAEGWCGLNTDALHVGADLRESTSHSQLPAALQQLQIAGKLVSHNSHNSHDSAWLGE